MMAICLLYDTTIGSWYSWNNVLREHCRSGLIHSSDFVFQKFSIFAPILSSTPISRQIPTGNGCCATPISYLVLRLLQESLLRPLRSFHPSRSQIRSQS